MSARHPSPTVDSDLLSRSHFVAHCHDVLDVLELSAGAVLGLQGPWGSGKTWVLQALKQRLAECCTEGGQHWVWIEVNPWMFSGSNQVVEQVLDEIGKQFLGGQVAAQVKKIGETLETVQSIGNKVLKFRRLLGKARGHMDWVEALSPQLAAVVKLLGLEQEDDEKDSDKPEASGDKQADRQALHDLKEELTHKLEAATFKVVIVYDDLDRMPPAEVCEVIQAVKAVANFPNVVHLMAYDEAVVAKALQSHLKIDDGRVYLEKIVNYELVVPAPLPSVFDEALSTQVQSALSAFLELPEPEAQLSHAEWQRALRATTALVKSPRDVERLLVRFRLAVRKLSKSIDVRDLLVVEALALKCPEVIHEFGATHASWAQSVNRSIERKKPVLALNSLPVASHSAAAFLIGQLSQGAGDTPRAVTGRGLEERDNWLSWWQHGRIEQPLTTRQLAEATQTEEAFRHSTLWEQPDMAIDCIRIRFAQDPESAQKAYKVMCSAFMKHQKLSEVRELFQHMTQREEFLIDWIKALSDEELKRSWHLLAQLCSDSALDTLFARGKSAAVELGDVLVVREKWLSNQSNRIFGMYSQAKDAVVAFEQITRELSDAEFAEWMRQTVTADSPLKTQKWFDDLVKAWVVTTSVGGVRKVALAQAVSDHLSQVSLLEQR